MQPNLRGFQRRRFTNFFTRGHSQPTKPLKVGGVFLFKHYLISKRANGSRNHEAGMLLSGTELIQAPLNHFEKVWNDSGILKSSWKRFATKAKELDKELKEQYLVNNFKTIFCKLLIINNSFPLKPTNMDVRSLSIQQKVVTLRRLQTYSNHYVSSL